MSKKVLLILGIVILLAVPLTSAFAEDHTPPWTGNPDPYACNEFEDCFWTVTVCIAGETYEVGIHFDPTEATDEFMEEQALGWTSTELTIGSCPMPAMPLVFDGLYAYGNTADGHTDEVCYIMSTRGEPSVDRRVATCENGGNWPDGEARPGWVETSYLLANGAVYDNGTAWGWWEGDHVAGSLRLPLREMDGYWSYLFKEFCHYTSEIGEAKGWCQ